MKHNVIPIKPIVTTHKEKKFTVEGFNMYENENITINICV